MAEIIKKLKRSGFEWAATGRLAIDNILDKSLENIDCFSIIISKKDEKKCSDFINKYNISNVNVIISEDLKDNYLTINGIKTIYNKQILEETAPRYFNNNKSGLEKRISLLMPK
jgi:hypothetical protein